jgi:fructose-1,6-bisphosphatase/inositol monophosphatase family enzyme
MTTQEKQMYQQAALEIAAQAVKIMKQYYRLDYDIRIKKDDTPVTIADTEINSMVIEQIRTRFPKHGVKGEEEVWQPDAAMIWSCDPIDGTSAYVIHLPTSMFSLALVEDGDPIVAVAANPWTADTYSAAKGGGAFRNDQPIRVSKRSWQEARIGTSGTGSNARNEFQENITAELNQETFMNRFSGVVFQGCLIAEGSLDGRVFFYDGAHDIAAVKLLVEEAGGLVTDIKGSQQRYDQPINGALASNGSVHKNLQEVVERYANSRN